jgi:thiamine pyrophosphate-dependent acetolactate synthase large subunit-like protein
MGGLNAAGIQMAYGAVAQAFEDSSPILVITAGVGQGGSNHTHYDIPHAFQSVTKCRSVDKAELIPTSHGGPSPAALGSSRPVLLVVPPTS